MKVERGKKEIKRFANVHKKIGPLNSINFPGKFRS